MQEFHSRTVGSAHARTRRRSVPLSEPLERRVLMDAAPLGDPILVNDLATRSTQAGHPAVAADADGDFVAAWSGNDGHIHARLFDQNGQARGGPVRVTDFPTSSHNHIPAVAMDSDGDFVVAWQGPGPMNPIDTRFGVHGLYARRYSAAGEPLGELFSVPTSSQYGVNPSVAMSSGGDSVIAWLGSGRVDDGILARRFNAEGVPQGDEFLVHSSTAPAYNILPSTAMDAAGNFVIAWETRVYDRPVEELGAVIVDADVYARRYGADGEPQGGAWPVNTSFAAFSPAAAMDAGGDSVIAFDSWDADVTMTGINARLYDAAGTPRGGQFQVNTHPPDGYPEPTAAMDPEGNFVIAWVGRDPGGDPAVTINARCYDANGTPQGGEFSAHSPYPPASPPYHPTAAMDAQGDFVIGWAIWNEGEIRARVFGEPGTPPAANVVGRHVFYNRSSLDGYDASPSAADDGAVAADKQALLPGQTASFSNVTSYTRGINGVMIDVQGLPLLTTELAASDFVFQVGTGGDAASWGDAPAPSQISVRRSAVPEQPARVTLVWPDGAIRNKWLRVTVKANGNTGLSAPEVFSFGNLVGEIGDIATPLRVSAFDVLAVRRNLLFSSPVAGRYDFDRDGRVGVRDYAAARWSLGRGLAPPGGPSPVAQAAPAVAPAVASDHRSRSSSRRVAYEILA